MRWTMTSSTVSASASSCSGSACTTGVGSSMICSTTGAAVNGTGSRFVRLPPGPPPAPRPRYGPETYAALNWTIVSVSYLRMPEPGTFGRW